MNSSEIRTVVERALRGCGPFSNLHGITRESLASLVIEPAEVMVDPDDRENLPRPMWLVLREPLRNGSGFFIAHDPEASTGALRWAVVERRLGTEHYTRVIAAESLAEALSGM